jgi:ADP-ribose pyrophosphatase
MANAHEGASSMRDARVLETEILLSKPKRVVRELVEMPDGYQCDWYYLDSGPSVLVVPLAADGHLVLVRQYRHNLKSHVLEFPAGIVEDGEELQAAAHRELREETGYVLASGARMRAYGAFYSLPSSTNKYTHIFLAAPVIESETAAGDAEIEKYFDMSVVLLPVQEALNGIGTTITSMETIGALMAARSGLASLGLHL